MKELCLFGLKHNQRDLEPQGLTGGPGAARCTAASITRTYHGRVLTLVQRTRINHYCTIDLKQIPGLCKCPSPASQPQVSIQPVGPIRNSARSSLFHPIGRIVSQSQSWLSLPRQTSQAHTSLLTLIGLCHIEQMSELIKTMCNVPIELA